MDRRCVNVVCLAKRMRRNVQVESDHTVCNRPRRLCALARGDRKSWTSRLVLVLERSDSRDVSKFLLRWSGFDAVARKVWNRRGFVD